MFNVELWFQNVFVNLIVEMNERMLGLQSHGWHVYTALLYWEVFPALNVSSTTETGKKHTFDRYIREKIAQYRRV